MSILSSLLVGLESLLTLQQTMGCLWRPLGPERWRWQLLEIRLLKPTRARLLQLLKPKLARRRRLRPKKTLRMPWITYCRWHAHGSAGVVPDPIRVCRLRHCIISGYVPIQREFRSDCLSFVSWCLRCGRRRMAVVDFTLRWASNSL